ncbi:MAG: ABC transporter substrate-binding protein [Thermomicrobiales bacterium]|nr:ABC transporter substrate-binding protein [Thermomicrobiales bacterium]
MRGDRFLGRWLVVAVLVFVSVVPAAPGAIRAQDASLVAPVDDEALSVTFAEGVVPTIFGDIELPASRERVVTLTDGALDGSLSVGVMPVGITRSSNGVSAAAYLEPYLEDEATYVGGWSELDPEAIIALQPDLILSDQYMTADQYDQLSQIATVIAPGAIEVSGPNGLQQWEYEQLIYGYALGKYDEAHDAILGVRQRAAGYAATSPYAGESVVVFRPQPEFAVVMSHWWITGNVLGWSGFAGNELSENTPAPHSGRDVGLERLGELEADWLLAATRDAEMSAELQVYLDSPLFAQLTAVENDRVFEVSGDLWSGATGVLAAHAMMDDIERIFGNGTATPEA